MTDPRPELVLRLGSHAEKDYVKKVSQFLDGIIVGANLLESTPGATSSLLLSLCGAKAKLPYYIDPMTYAFGTYVDRATGELRDDLDWIKSDQKVTGKKETTREFKRSYVGLGAAFGSVFQSALAGDQALTADRFTNPAEVAEIVASVLDYQLNRIRQEFESDPEFREYTGTVPQPAALFAPYFYCEPTSESQWLTANLKLATAAASRGSAIPVHAVVCADRDVLLNSEFMARLVAELPTTGVAGVWLWFSRFVEDEASLPHLQSFRRLVSELNGAGLKVYNMHGGYFSLALSKHGLAGVSHGTGYGEQKDVVPIIGQSIPTVRYYLPALYKRLGVPDIERAFPAMGVRTPADFHEKVCDCAVCTGLVVNSVQDFRLFGETQPSASKKRAVQTPAAAQRCRFHFLIARIRERNRIAALSINDIQAEFDTARDGWGSQPSLEGNASHLMKWRAAIG